MDDKIIQLAETSGNPDHVMHQWTYKDGQVYQHLSSSGLPVCERALLLHFCFKLISSYFLHLNPSVNRRTRFIMASQIRQNYDVASEAAVNKQINLELYASYVYLSMAYHYDRDDVALPGLHKFFKELSHEEKEHAEEFMKFQNKRGGRIVLNAIAAPSSNEWGTALEGLQVALDLEKQVNTSLLELSKTSDRTGDPHMTDYLDKYLEEQVESIQKLGKMITQLKRAGPQGLGEYLFDKELSS